MDIVRFFIVFALGVAGGVGMLAHPVLIIPAYVFALGAYYGIKR